MTIQKDFNQVTLGGVRASLPIPDIVNIYVGDEKVSVGYFREIRILFDPVEETHDTKRVRIRHVRAHLPLNQIANATLLIGQQLAAAQRLIFEHVKPNNHERIVVTMEGPIAMAPLQLALEEMQWATLTHGFYCQDGWFEVLPALQPEVQAAPEDSSCTAMDAPRDEEFTVGPDGIRRLQQAFGITADNAHSLDDPQ